MISKNQPPSCENEKNQHDSAGNKSIEEFLKDGYQVVKETLKLSNSLPSGKKFKIYTVDSYKTTLQECSDNILSSMNSILRKNEVKGNMRNNVLEKKTELLIEACDVILERVTNNIDEVNGIRKNDVEPMVFQTVSVQLPVNGSWNRVSKPVMSATSAITSSQTTASGSSTQTIRLITAENIVRPQKFFKDKIDNSRQRPWEPRIKEKPNSIKPLAIFLEETENGQEYSHPYECELDKFSPPEDQLRKSDVVKPKLLKDTPLVEITQEEQLNDLVEDLRSAKEIGIDLEHHSYRSFMGITCLLQISTLEKDYLIDTLVLRDKLYILNEIFTDPKIIKIFHGAKHDIQWLQRDLSLYVVNMFDTHFAAKQLEYPGLSLAYLMQKFCNFAPNKQFQLADWRIRPLPHELKTYAREDTHYLIYIYQNMKNELIDKYNGQPNLLKSVIQMSTDLCKTRYVKPVFTSDSYLNLYRRCSRMFHNRQLFALQELYRWRDEISREEDESTGYVLPNNMLLEISERLPREMQGILACCNPTPPLVKANLLDLHKIMLKALEQPFESPILKEDTRSRGITTKISKIDVNNPLHCPHDLTKREEVCDNLPTILSGDSINLDSIFTHYIEEDSSVSSIFDFPVNAANETRLPNKLEGVLKFLSPYARYKLIKPFMQAREQKIVEEREKKIAEENAKNEKVVANDDQTETKTDDNRTDEDRIEGIRKHFLKLSNQAVATTSSKENDKKRKRDNSVDFNSDFTEIPGSEEVLPDSGTLQERLSENADSNAREWRKFDTNGHKGKGNKKKNKMKRKQMSDREQTQDGETSVNSCSSLTAAQKNNNQRDKLRKAQKNKQFWQNRKKGQKKNISQPSNDNSSNQNQQQFNAYDYSMVDFRQFQGGARGVDKPKAFKSKFKSKGKKRNIGNRNPRKTI